MSIHFEDDFYTNDFDREMMYFVANKYELSSVNWKLGHGYFKYGRSVGGFWTSDDTTGFKYLTKQQFKEKIGMTTKQFTKADLVAGKHVFKTRDGSLNLVIDTQNGTGAVNLTGQEYFGNLREYQEDLTYKNHVDLDIVEVYEISYPNIFECLKHKLKSIWKRTEKTETQIQFEKLQQQIADLQAQANKLQATL